MTFQSFNLHPAILTRVEALGYKIPTPIQRQSIPSILKGHDLMGLAQTGTGKTAAFALPLLQRLVEGTPSKLVRALVIAPTRELAQQTHEAINQLAKNTQLKSTAIYGGVSMNSQIQQLRRGPAILVACPGRLLDLLERGVVNLMGVEVIIIDEADQLFDMGFLPDLRRILKQLPKKRQSLLFSATMPPDVRRLAHDILQQPVTVQIDNTVPVKAVKQLIYPVPQHLKTALLVKILQTNTVTSTLIFTRTRNTAGRVAEHLEELGYAATSLQGNLSQKKRQTALNDFRKGKFQVLVATDIAARGIDVEAISHVINYDMPETVEIYTHRIGRTGRASKSGIAMTFVTRPDLERVRSVEQVLGMKLEQLILADFDYKAGSPVADKKSRPPRANTGGRTESRFKPATKRFGPSQNQRSRSADEHKGREKKSRFGSVAATRFKRDDEKTSTIDFNYKPVNPRLLAKPLSDRRRTNSSADENKFKATAKHFGRPPNKRAAAVEGAERKTHFRTGAPKRFKGGEKPSQETGKSAGVAKRFVSKQTKQYDSKK